MPILQFFRQNSAWLGAGVLLAFMSSFGQTFFISIFSGHIRAEFGLSHAAWGGFYSLGTTASAIVMVWLGTLSDVLRTRVLGLFVLSGLMGATLVMANLSHVFYLPFAIFALRLLGQGMCSHLAVVAMSRWFVAQSGARAVDRGTGIFVRRSFSARIVRVFNGLCVVALFMVRCCRDAFIVFTSFISIAASRANPAIHGGR